MHKLHWLSLKPLFPHVALSPLLRLLCFIQRLGLQETLAIGGKYPILSKKEHSTLIFFVGSGCYLPAPADRVHTVHAWLLQHLLRRLRHSSMHSYMHGTLSEAMTAYEQCVCGSRSFNSLALDNCV